MSQTTFWPSKSKYNNSLYNIVRPIYGWLDDNEILFLNHTALAAIEESEDGEKFIEIGSFMGRSTVTIALAMQKLKKGKLIAIDPHSMKFTQKRDGIKSSLKYLKHNLYINNLNKYVEIIVATSSEAFKDLKIKNVRYLFLDGDHEKKAIFNDFNLWDKALVNNGYLLIHDTLNIAGPRSLLLKLMFNNKYEYRGNVGELAFFIKRKHISFKNRIKKLLFSLILNLFMIFYSPKIS